MSTLAVLALALGPALQGKFGTTTSLRVGADETPHAAVLADVNGDGARDLVIAVSGPGAEGSNRSARSLRVHLRRSEGLAFATKPDHLLAVTPDVSAFAVADVHADPGSELVLLSASGVFAWRPRSDDDRKRFVQLFEAEFLWQLPGLEALLAWQTAVVDMDKDGLADLIVPEPEGYRVALQRRDESGVARFEVQPRLRVPDDPKPFTRDLNVGGDGAAIRGQRGTGDVGLSFELGSDDVEKAPILSVSESVPAPLARDWDGDGDLDLMAQGSRELYVWVLDDERTLRAAPDVRLELPVARDRTRMFDVSYSAHAFELDGDGRVDCLIFAGDKRADEPRTQMLVFGQRGGSPLFGEDKLPLQLLVFAGFAGFPSFDDVDGDGRLDLVIGALRQDFLDLLRTASSQAIDIELYAYLNQGGVFSKRPDLKHTLSLPVEAVKVTTRFFGDVTGDGVSELFQRDRPDRLRLFLTRKGREELTVLDKPLWEQRIEAEAEIEVHVADGRYPPEVVVVESDEVLHVSFP